MKDKKDGPGQEERAQRQLGAPIAEEVDRLGFEPFRHSVCQAVRSAANRILRAKLAKL